MSESDFSTLRLRIDGAKFRDVHNREVTLRGINVAGDAKFPARPHQQTSHTLKDFFEGDDVSFVGRPFSVEDAPTHFARLKSWGYNTIRYIFTWEAIEHAGPGKYDEAWLQHTVSVLRLAKRYGFFVFMDPHQDVWSRFSGGSGAPMWTLYACGLNPKTFDVTEAAIVHNTYSDPENYPAMIWSTNYTRLVCQVMFTLFFAGKSFAPNAILDGVNIQDYLQDHFLGAIKQLALRIHEAGDLENDVVIGWESLNEPHRGLVGWQNLTVVPKDQHLQKGTSPTAWQAILTGSGRACEIETWDFGRMGPFKSGSTLVDPHGVSAWLPAHHDDTKYGWKRDPKWQLGECLWAQQGVWDPSTDTLLRPDHFARHPETGQVLNYEAFTNTFFMDLYRKYVVAVRTWHSSAILFCQPAVMEIPPSIKDTPDSDANMVFAPHFYDGITLLTKKWNRLWNVDVFGILRGKYWSPALGIKIGETAIRNCFRDQLAAMRDEGLDRMGIHPCVFTEIGIPYDMDEKNAYKTGDYSSQVAAMDANHFALEGSLVNGFTLWVYMTMNDHFWGDQWNGEDLSIISKDDPTLPTIVKEGVESPQIFDSTDSLTKAKESATRSPDVGMDSQDSSSTRHEVMTAIESQKADTASSCRAGEAYVRPSPIAVHGDLLSYGFNLRKGLFTLKINAPSATTETTPTTVFLPAWHYPSGHTAVKATGGKWMIETVDGLQMLKWWHAEGEQSLTITGVQQAMFNDSIEEEPGYVQQYREAICQLM